MLLAIMAIGTTTYAWLQTTSFNYVRNLEITATDGSALGISIDGVNFYENITGDMLRPIVENLQFDAITSVDGRNFTKLGVTSTTPNRDYVSLDLWFRSTADNRSVYLTDNNKDAYQMFDNPPKDSTYIASKGVRFTSSYDFQYKPDLQIFRGDSRNYYAALGMRISGTELINDLNPLDVRDQSELKNTFIFDSSEDEVMGYGKPYGALNYYNISKNSSLVAPIDNTNTIYELSKYNGDRAFSEDSLVTRLVPDGSVNDSLKPYYVGKCHINVWLEGWDADTFDSVVEDIIKITLGFRLMFESTWIR
jgi:hypothetical protein